MELTVVPDKGLTRTSRPVTAADLRAGTYTALIEKMREAMTANNGIGLAANQAGQDCSLFVIDTKLADEHGVSSVFANPEIADYGTETDEVEEGCLSIPGYWTLVVRSKKIMFKALDGNGIKVKFRARGLLARVLQHETDHLNGVTIQERIKERRP
jgi:peptide deformylase